MRGASTSGEPGQCEHNLQMSLCKECGGACICQHNRERSRCKECRGGSVCHSTIGTGAIARRAKQRKTTRCRQISRSSKIDPCSLLPRHKSILVPRLFLIGLHASPKAWQQVSNPIPRAKHATAALVSRGRRAGPLRQRLARCACSSSLYRKSFHDQCIRRESENLSPLGSLSRSHADSFCPPLFKATF